MAKPKLNDFKKYLATLDEASLRVELLKLFGKLAQVQEFYAQELMGESGRKEMLDAYKNKIYAQFWTRGGNPRNPSNAEIRTLISTFEKVSVFPHELADLLLYRVEVATAFADDLGGMSEGDYNAACRAFEKVVALIAANKLHDHFRLRIETLLRFHNLDYWYTKWLKDAYQTHLGS